MKGRCLLVLLAGALVGVAATGCGEKTDGTENAAPPPSANAIAPPVVPNGVQGGPGDMRPGTGGPGTGGSGAPAPLSGGR